MVEEKSPNRFDIKTGGGNYNEKIEGNYIEAQNVTFIERIEGHYIQSNNNAAKPTDYSVPKTPVKNRNSSEITTDPIKVFFSYSHQDEKLRDELAKHLKLMQRQGVISTWYDHDTNAGAEWAEEINTHLNCAHIILLLISADFLTSDYCFDIELERAMERHEANEAVVIPIILRPVDWKNSKFSKLRPLPTNGKPVTTWLNLDEAFLDIAQGIRKVIENY